MNKKRTGIISGIVIVLLLSVAFVAISKHQDKKAAAELTVVEKKTAKELKTQYDRLAIGGQLKETNKKLGKPIYTESATDDFGNAETVYTWGSNQTGEVGAKLTVGVEDGNIVEKAVSGLYVAYDKKKAVSADEFEKIEMNKNFSIEQATQKFGQPNAIAEYKDGKAETIQTLTWETNTSGPIGSYFTIIFTNGIATSKNEIGLV